MGSGKVCSLTPSPPPPSPTPPPPPPHPLNPAIICCNSKSTRRWGLLRKGWNLKVRRMGSREVGSSTPFPSILQ